jgi:hypothetical protein
MLVTLCARALKGRLRGHAPGGSLALTDLPRLAREELGLSGMVLSTDLLVGADRQSLTKILEAADKAGCPCLVLIEVTPQPLASDDENTLTAATDRLLRVAQAAAWLGCSAFSLAVDAPDSDDALADTAASLKPISRRSEKLELNLCVAPYPGLTATPERTTELLKKIGGFRVGTLPDIAVAMVASDPLGYMRRLAPYASAILVPSGPIKVEAPKASGKKKSPVAAAPAGEAKPKKRKSKKAKGAGEDAAEVDVAAAAAPEPEASGVVTLEDMVDVLSAVGFDGPLALDFKGPGDPMPALLATRDIIFKAIGRPDPAAPLLDLDDLPDEPEAAEAAGEEDEE